MEGDFEAQYQRLNKAQKEAVEALEGPVMVVAGPGTGKTQVLALRIANILKKTDVKADGILCLTFTNSAVEAMKTRLAKYIGEEADKVNIFTFHSFGMKVIGEYYKVLGLKDTPRLLEDTQVAIFFDKILEHYDWEYLRPRGDGAKYYKDLRQLISLLKRERISNENFLNAIDKEIDLLKNDEGSISTRGESKGEIKKEVLKDIEGLEKSREIAKFIEIYEEEKKKDNVLDYDDVLENLVKIVESSEDAAADIRERYLYVLIDEHQDSSRVQNEFIARTWGDIEAPDLFVVGDDRQLIYGFSGASIEHFAGFKKTFPDAKLITLVDNYRSTQVILDAAHSLLQSVMTKDKLVSQSKEHHPIKLVETENDEEEIVAAAEDIKNKIKLGLDISDCAILVPKNVQVRRALEMLHREGVPISSLGALNFFDQEEARALLRVLKIIESGDNVSLALSFFDKFSGLTPYEAHEFIVGQYMREFSLEKLSQESHPDLFGSSKAQNWIAKILKWRQEAQDVEDLVRSICEELFAQEKKELISGTEVLNTVLTLLAPLKEKNPNLTLSEFISYLDRLMVYGEQVPVVFLPKKGVEVMTMHGAKGLEFDYVWIAHMDERSLNSGKKMGFKLPESISGVVEDRDIDAVKRKVYVAITRAKRFCTLSYSIESRKGSEKRIAEVIADLPEEILEREKFAAKEKPVKEKKDLAQLKKLVANKYKDRYVSASMLNNFFECPRKWYFQNLLQLPMSPFETLEFGSAVHASIDKILKMTEINAVELEKTVDNIVKDALGALRVSDRSKVRMGKDLMGVLKNWLKNRLPHIGKSRKTEEGISIVDELYPHLKIFGKIDLIENLPARPDDSGHSVGGPKEVRVTDFKTGSAKRKSEIEKLDEEGRMGSNLRQLAMYSYLLRKNPKWGSAARESRLEFLEAKNPKEIFYDKVIGEEEIELLVKDIKDYDELVSSGEWLERECHYNSYGKNTECEYCKLAEIYYK